MGMWGGQTAADHFNRDVKKGVLYLQSVGLLSEPPAAGEVAWFFKSSIGLDKRVVGDYLGERDDFNQAVLHKSAPPPSLPQSAVACTAAAVNRLPPGVRGWI